ncbi:MAG: EamA family transporter [Desulfoferrobacter sp.]
MQLRKQEGLQVKVAASFEKSFENSTQRLWLYAKLVLTAILWGGTFVAGRSIANQIDPFSAAFLRFMIASLFLAAFVWHSYGKIPLLGKKDLLLVLLLGLSGVFAYNVFFFSGLKTVAASRASLIIATNPAFIALFSCWLLQERLNRLKIFGICLSMSGAVVVISHGNPFALLDGGMGWGELYIFGCVLSWVLYSLIGKSAMTRLTPLVAVTYSCIIGAGCLFPPACARGLCLHLGDYSLVVWVGVLYLGFFGSALGFFWYYEGIRAFGASRAGVFINIVPVSAILLAHLILKEALDGSLMIGALFVIAGVYYTNRPARRES